jgi:hypothetical protein
LDRQSSGGHLTHHRARTETWPIVLLAIGLGFNILVLFYASMELSGCVTAFSILGLAFYIRKHPSRKVNRVAYIWFGATGIGFVLFGFILLLNLAFDIGVVQWVADWLGSGIAFIFVIGLLVAGGFVGDRMGGRRDYRIPR